MLEITQEFFEKTGELSQAGIQVESGLGMIIGMGLAFLGFRYRRFWLILLAVIPGLLAGASVGLSLHILQSVSEQFSMMVLSVVTGGILGGVIFGFLGHYAPRLVEAGLMR